MVDRHNGNIKEGGEGVGPTAVAQQSANSLNFFARKLRTSAPLAFGDPLGVEAGAVAVTVSEQASLDSVFNVTLSCYPFQISYSTIPFVSVLMIDLLTRLAGTSNERDGRQYMDIYCALLEILVHSIPGILAARRGVQYSPSPADIRSGLTPSDAPKIGDIVDVFIGRARAPLFGCEFFWGKVLLRHIVHPPVMNVCLEPLGCFSVLAARLIIPQGA